MDRRSVLLQFAAAAGLAGLPLSTLLAPRPARANRLPAPETFDFAWLKGHARHLAAQPHAPAREQVPQALKDISWDDYQSIQFKADQALWHDDDNAFEIGFFHLGLYFQEPVHLFELVNGQPREIPYSPDNFTYKGEQSLEGLPEDLGYAGFRVRFHTDDERDLAAFLGASYFRAVGESMQYGLSARGLAVDTAMASGEEFPRFTAFWFEQPPAGSSRLTLYALLESDSVTGAYAFDLYPGKNMVMDIDAAIYPRRSIERIGVAPLTSMYQMGENDRRMANDWRPEIHDSDGLSLWTGSGEWIWRPLRNPRHLQVNSFLDNNPRGFGLLQRDRNFDHYQDDSVFYGKRPSLWVEPGGGWGKGSVMLVEIPTADETMDNIVAFWRPEKPLEAGREHLFSYRLNWGENPPVTYGNLATVQATRTGIGGVVGQKRTYFSRRFAIDFAGGLLDMMGEDAEVEPVIEVSRGKVEITSARPLDAINGYRAMFDLVPDDSSEPIDMRVYLRLGDQPLTETWVYQYTPPPMAEREY